MICTQIAGVNAAPRCKRVSKVQTDMYDDIQYLTPIEIYEAAAEILGETPVARDPHLVRVAAARPLLRAFGTEAYPTLMDKASALLHALAAHHVFWDGNKRAATQATTRFLYKNGLQPTWTHDEMVAFVLSIAQNQLDLPAIAAWLKAHTQPVTRYVTIDELVHINERLVGGAGIHTIVEGMRAVRDMNLLDAAVARPAQSVFGQDAYPTLTQKAAALLHAIARNHPFADGNKRTATVGALFMLEVNGRRVIWEGEDALNWIVDLAEGRRDLEAFAAWLPLVSTNPTPTPDAERDIALIDRLLYTHHDLLMALALR